MSEYTPWAKHIKDDRLRGDFMTDYLNRDDVRTALHIPAEVPAWEECSETFNKSYHLQDEGSLWIYNILKGKVRMMFYSGDTDGAIPTFGSK